MYTLPHNKLELLNGIISKEWAMFSAVENIGGKASCQEDFPTFLIMRLSQFLAWDVRTLCSYYADLEAASESSVNLMTLKYAYMMALTHPEEYADISAALPLHTLRKRLLVNRLLALELKNLAKLELDYPELALLGRPLLQKQASKGTTSIEAYTFGELLTYSELTLESLKVHLHRLAQEGKNYNKVVLENTLILYGKISVG